MRVPVGAQLLPHPLAEEPMRARLLQDLGGVVALPDLRGAVVDALVLRRVRRAVLRDPEEALSGGMVGERFVVVRPCMLVEGGTCVVIMPPAPFP